MRIVSVLARPAIGLLLALTAAIAFPDIASAEWQAATWPCDVAPGATLAQPVLWFPEGEPAMAPTGYFTDGREGAPPASDFTATAVWGDGAVSPAIVEATGVGGCYEVAAPEHIYNTVGAFDFSYDVHDAAAGLDHTLAATELHTWSLVPQLLSGPSSLTIHPTVGVPWSGTVGEFGLESNELYLPYTAQIEWGGGEPSTPGTVTKSGTTVSISGSFTYAQPFDGAIVVLLSWGSRLLGTWTTSGVDAAEPHAAPDLAPPAPFALLGRPVLAYVRHRRRSPTYEIVFRLNQSLPLTSTGQIGATVVTGGRSSAVASLANACYAAKPRGIGGHVREGRGYPFTLVIPNGQPVEANQPAHDRGLAVPHRFANARRLRSFVDRQLGC